ncbi:hypothetical protein [Lacunimicrobium album]
MLASPQEIDQFATYAKQKLCEEQSDKSLEQLFADWRGGEQSQSRELELNAARIQAILQELDGDPNSEDSCEVFVSKVRDELTRKPR